MELIIILLLWLTTTWNLSISIWLDFKHWKEPDRYGEPGVYGTMKSQTAKTPPRQRFFLVYPLFFLAWLVLGATLLRRLGMQF
jgi:steroid 5-alpha reductase family enzyme